MDQNVAQSVLECSLEIMNSHGVRAITSRVCPAPEPSAEESFVIEHELNDKLLAQFVQILFVDICATPVQLQLVRKEDPLTGRWIVRQQGLDLVSTYTGQVCDDLIEKTSSLELAADPNWEKGIREKIPSEYADRVKLVVGYSEKGRQVILWGIPGEQQARDLHFYLLQCCTEMKCSSHFNPGALARLDPRFQTTGWVVVTREE